MADNEARPRPGIEAYVRSVLFNALFYVSILIQMIVFLPVLVLPRRYGWWVVRNWARSCVWLLRVVAGVKLEVRGRTDLGHGPALVAAKHQSVVETFAILIYLSDPTFILKHELNLIPIFGWWSMRMGMIPVKRGKRSAALRDMTDVATRMSRSGHQVVIFPEGTRTSPGAPPRYKIGIAHLYESCGVPCLPVALNTGVYWPRRRFLRFPGTAVIEFLDPIAPGLSRPDFMAALEERVETASDRLLLEAAEDRRGLPLPETAEARVAELKAQETGGGV